MSRPGILRAQAVVAALCAAAVLAPILALAGAPARTNDLWFHLGAGRAYAEQGPWPDGDPMLHTAHADAPVQHEWLFGLGAHGVVETVGFAGLRALHAAAVVAAALLAFVCFRRAGCDAVVSLCGATLFLVLAWWRLIQLRPDLFSIPATLAVYAFVIADGPGPGRARIAAAAALALVWANVHSLFALGPALVVAALLAIALQRLLGEPLRDGDERRGTRLAAAGGAMLVAAVLNPRGVGQHLTFFTSSRDTAIWAISDEWRPFDPFHWPEPGFSPTPLAWGLAEAAVLGTVLLAATRTVSWLRAPSAGRAAAARRLDALHLGLAAAGTVALLVSVRFVWMVVFPLLYLARALPVATTGPRWLAVGLCAATALALPGPGMMRERLATLPDPERYVEWPWDPRPFPSRSLRFLMDTGVSGRAFNRYTHGGFLGYWLAPRVRTFVDGRTEHYPTDVLEDYFSITHRVPSRAGEDALALLDRRGVDLYLGVGLPIEGERVYTTTHLEGAADWIPVSRSVDHAVWLRRGERNRENLDRIAAWYAEAGVPFDRQRGFDPLRAARRRPDWAVAHGVVPPDYSQLLADRTSDDGARRARALERLGALYYLLGAYPEQIEIDRENSALRPRAVAPRRRLVLSLLRLGRDAEAAIEVARLAEQTGGAPPTTALARLVRAVEQLRIGDEPRPPGAAITAVPAFTRDDAKRFFGTGAPRVPQLPERRG